MLQDLLQIATACASWNFNSTDEKCGNENCPQCITQYKQQDSWFKQEAGSSEYVTGHIESCFEKCERCKLHREVTQAANAVSDKIAAQDAVIETGAAKKIADAAALIRNAAVAEHSFMTVKIGQIVSAASPSALAHTRTQVAQKVEDEDDVYFYQFTFTAGKHTHPISKRFSEYRKIHDQLDALDPDVEFRSKWKKLLFDKENREEREERHEELLQWLMGSLCSSAISHNSLFHSLFGFPAEMVEKCERSVEARQQRMLMESARHSEALRKAREKFRESRIVDIKENTLDMDSIMDIKV